MKARPFILQPFAPVDRRLEVEFAGEIVRRAGALAIAYLLQGSLAEVQMPASLNLPARRDRLWEETCFEFFLAVKGAPHYWEFNLSPAGFWNVYHFSDYRQGMTVEPAFLSLPFEVQNGPKTLRLRLAVDLARIVQPDQTLEVGIAAILQLKNGETTYWSLTHTGPRPDFHRRDSFRLTL